MTNLIIVESPTKAKTLNRFLGKGYHVEATMGHLKDLPKSKLGVDLEKDFEPDYMVVEAKSKTISALLKAAKSSKDIYLATDPDREGEAIAEHVAEILKDSKLKISPSKLTRITFHEITKGAVEDALSHPGKINHDLVNAQIARRVLDRLVGYKLSPVLWKKVRRGLSAGRVQTVVVRLIVEREKEIEAFKPKEYWEIASEVKTKKSDNKKSFLVNLVKIDGKAAVVPDEKTAKKVVGDLEKSKYVVSEVAKRESKKGPFPPYTTSTLTQAASNVMGWSSKKTMSIAQKLYEEGLITYHRTDSVNIAQTALDSARKYIQTEFGDKYLPPTGPRVYKTKSKSAQEAHEAIRPTNLEIKSPANAEKKLADKFEKDGERLYDLIWRRFVASQMADSVYDSTRIDVVAGKYLLRANGLVIKFDGWRKVMPAKKVVKTDSDGEAELPELSKDELLDLIKVISEQKFTQPPARYNEASLIKTLEKLGIGRPSTYAPTISTVIVRNYVERENRQFKPTQIGITVNDFLMKHFPDVFDYSFTAEMEDDLDHVAEGKVDWRKMMKNFYGPFEKKVEKTEKESKRVQIPTEPIGRKCPTCKQEGRIGDKQGELVIRTGRFGKFISCSLFPECKHTEKYLEKIDMKCPKCEEEGRTGKDRGDIIVKKTKKGRTFFGCSRYPDCDYASWTNPNAKKDEEKSEDKTSEE